MIDIFLLRHAQSVPSQAVDEEVWPLSKLGKQQATAIIPTLTEIKPDAIYTSPYARSLFTVKPYANSVRQNTTVVSGFREKTHAIPWGKEHDFHGMIRKNWDDFDFAMPDGESNNQALKRFSKALYSVAKQRNNKRLLISSHGTVIALFLNSLDSEYGYQQWRDMPMPALYRTKFDGTAFSQKIEPIHMDNPRS